MEEVRTRRNAIPFGPEVDKKWLTGPETTFNGSLPRCPYIGVRICHTSKEAGSMYSLQTETLAPLLSPCGTGLPAMYLHGNGGRAHNFVKAGIIAGLQLRFHDLRHTCITKLAESQASEQTHMAISGHVSRRMIEHYSHIRMEAKRTAVDAIAKPAFDEAVAQNWAQSPTAEKTTAAN